MRYCTEKYAPEYALMLDSKVAKAHGYEDIFAMIGLSSCDDVFTMPTPPEAWIRCWFPRFITAGEYAAGLSRRYPVV